MGQQASVNQLSVPYEKRIDPAIAYGTQIHVFGTATGDRFEVNLTNDRGDIVLHINPRVNDRVLVLNSAPAGNWGTEERKPLNISHGENFTIIFMVNEQGFKIAVNNQHIADYNHRLQLTSAEKVTIKGDVTLSDVLIYPGFHQYGQPWLFAMETPVPINVFPGRVLYIDGRVNSSASRFEFNLLTGTNPGADVAFHFNPRFDQRQVVRNSSQNGAWGDEERQGDFPLQSGEDFEIQIICFADHYQVNGNGQPWFTYRHRLPYQSVQALQIKGDVTVTNVRAL